MRSSEGFAGFVAQHPICLGAHTRLIGVRDTDEHADGPHRELGAQVENEVEPVGADQRIEAGVAECADLVLDHLHLAGREGPAHDLAMDGVQRWVFVDEYPGRHHRVGFDDFEDVALCGTEPLRVPQRRVDVGVAAQAPEVVSLVVVERGLVA
jgi:hypothetical protein